MGALSTDLLVIERDGVLYKTSVASVSSGDGSVPVGGTTGQVLTKASDTNYDATWAEATPGSLDYGLITDPVTS